MSGLSVQRAAAEARSALGEGFVSCFYDRVEDALGVEVIVVPLSEDGCSLTLGGHKVIVVAATEHWYRSNFTLAHELGHFLVEGASSLGGQEAEDMANAFAADLLMPVERVGSVDWGRATAATVAQLCWEFGVSTQALEVRLRYLRVTPGDEARSALARSTAVLLRNSLASSVASPADVSARVQYSARRRFPERVVTGLRRAVADGKAPQASLCWVLGLPAQEERDDDDEAVDSHGLDRNQAHEALATLRKHDRHVRPDGLRPDRRRPVGEAKTTWDAAP
ncbi:ImmA/IrrE family metallo-endopeptidase [Actinomyces sp. zg296]|uniref:ImmA/IrrE family metallo-endopeptidase n=1 Tax=Actinomyces sp. zg296 TaxID=2609289 RepID=UPI00135A489B|nr:ImmA/IrrE family metallo-endopeptidase [Actinomyces sp. zg296]